MSTEFYFPSRTSQRWLRVGPLAGDLDRFATRLKAQGYAHPSAVSKLRLVSNLSRWLEHQGLGVEALDEPRIEAFLLTRGPRCVRRGEATTARQLLSHLRASGRVHPVPSSPENSNPFAQIEWRYERFLVNERGLSRATVENYLPIIHTFLAKRFATGAVALTTLTVRDLNRFIVRQSQRLSRSRAKLLVTALRSFLRHLHQRGDIPADLAGALLPVVSWRLSGVPKSLAPEQVEAIIDSCDLRTAAGRRDRAILLLLARLTSNAAWSFGGKTFEIDLVGQIDRAVLIIEAKSVSLTPEGFRGAPARVKRHVRDLVVDPADQSARLEQIIRDAKAGVPSCLDVASSLAVDARTVDTVVRMSVTLDDFSMIASCEGELRAAGWVPSATRLAPTLNVADLICISDILDDPSVCRFLLRMYRTGEEQGYEHRREAGAAYIDPSTW